jgi:hypothetical protein
LKPGGYYLVSSAVYESSRHTPGKKIVDGATGQSYDVYDDDCLYDSGTDYYYEPLENYPSEREQIEACADTFIVNGRTYIPKRCYRDGQVGRAYHNEIPHQQYQAGSLIGVFQWCGLLTGTTGDQRNAAEIAVLLNEAGFVGGECKPIDHEQSIVIGRKE